MERFWSKTRRCTDTGCLLWTGATKAPSKSQRYGGGQTLPHGKFWWEGRSEGAHRVALALHRGVPVRSLGLVAHECDNPLCVNPDHLSEGTASSNLQEAWDRGRRTGDHLQALCDWFDQQGALARSEPTTCPTNLRLVG